MPPLGDIARDNRQAADDGFAKDLPARLPGLYCKPGNFLVRAYRNSGLRVGHRLCRALSCHVYTLSRCIRPVNRKMIVCGYFFWDYSLWACGNADILSGNQAELSKQQPP